MSEKEKEMEERVYKIPRILADKFDEVKYVVETEDGVKEKYADDYDVKIRVIHFYVKTDIEYRVDTVPIDRIYRIEHNKNLNSKIKDDEDGGE